MEKKTILAILVFLGCGLTISLMAVLVFNLKLNNDQSKLQSKVAILTSANDQDWAESPGSQNIQINNHIWLFTRSKIDGKENYNLTSIPYNYTHEFKYEQMAYIPSTEGYVSYLPSRWFTPQFNENEIHDTVSSINLIAAQKFYQGLNAPPMQKVPSYLNLIINSLRDDLLVTHLANVIRQFYVSDKTATDQTIFYLASLSQQQIDDLWTDRNYGWQAPETFKYWIKVSLDMLNKDLGFYQELKGQFVLSDAQMEALVGESSLVYGMMKMAMKVITDKIKNMQSVYCASSTCTPQELAIAQWAGGFVINSDAFPGIIYPEGGYSAINSSIPAHNDKTFGAFELYLGDSDGLLTVDQAFSVTVKNFELQKSLFNFNTERTIFQNQNNTNKIQALLQLQSNDTAEVVVEYLEKLRQWKQQGVAEYLSLEIYKYITRMLEEGSKILNFGLFSKALINQNLDCQQVLDQVSFKSKVCTDTNTDFTKNYNAGKLWAEAFYFTQNTESDAFQSIMKNLELTDPTDLQNFLWKGQYSTIITPLVKDVATQFKCKNADKCGRRELFMQQWLNCSVTLNPPASLKLQDSEKVCGVSEWEPERQKVRINFEIAAFLSEYKIESKKELPEDKLRKLFNYDMGGLLGYYSLFNLTSAVYNNTQLSNEFQFALSDVEFVLSYLIQGLQRYVYGGLVVETNVIDYLWNQQNAYTDMLSKMSPLDGGASWRSNAAYLFEKNNDEFIHAATFDDKSFVDTGIVNLDDVRSIKKVLGDKSVKQKWVIYRNLKNNYSAPHYFYPFGNETYVDGTSGLGFHPDIEGGDLKMFSEELFRTLKLKSKGETTYKDSKAQKYELEDQALEMNSVNGYPLVVTIGKPTLKDCELLISNQSCQEFVNDFADSNTNEVIVDKITGLTLKQEINLFYWLNVTNDKILLDGYELPTAGLRPLAYRQIMIAYSDDNVSNNLKDVNHIHKQRTIQFIVFFTIGGIFAIALGFGIFYYCKNKDRFEDTSDYQVMPQ